MDASFYFNEKEWSQKSHYDKLWAQNSITLMFIEMIEPCLGFNKLEKPDFVSKHEKRVEEKIKIEIIEKFEYPDYVLNDGKIKIEKFENPEVVWICEKREEDKESEIVKIKEIKNEKIENTDVDLKFRRYPKRKLPAINYYEEDDDEDCYIFCDFCQNEYLNGCPQHPLIPISDHPVPLKPRNPKRARLTIPSTMLRIAESSIPNAGEGVFTQTNLKMGLRFGPYEGTSRRRADVGNYTWQLKQNGKMKVVDGRDQSKSNWMRFVNCPRNSDEQNLMAFSYQGKMYYRTVRNIPVNTEILVYYGNEFAKLLGIDVKMFKYIRDTKKRKVVNKM